MKIDVLLGKLCCLNRQSMKIKSISGPSQKANNEEKPIFRLQLSKEREWILQGLRLYPFAMDLAEVVLDSDSLSPVKQVSP